MLVRYGVWKKLGPNNFKTKNGKLILRNREWDDENTHKIIKAKIRKLHPGYMIQGYANCTGERYSKEEGNRMKTALSIVRGIVVVFGALSLMLGVVGVFDIILTKYPEDIWVLYTIVSIVIAGILVMGLLKIIIFVVTVNNKTYNKQ